MLPALAHVIRPLKLLIELELEESVVQQNSRIHLSGKSGHFLKTRSADLVVVYLPTEQNVRLLQWRIFRIRDLLQVRQRKKINTSRFFKTKQKKKKSGPCNVLLLPPSPETSAFLRRPFQCPVCPRSQQLAPIPPIECITYSCMQTKHKINMNFPVHT